MYTFKYILFILWIVLLYIIVIFCLESLFNGSWPATGACCHKKVNVGIFFSWAVTEMFSNLFIAMNLLQTPWEIWIEVERISPIHSYDILMSNKAFEMHALSLSLSLSLTLSLSHTHTHTHLLASHTWLLSLGAGSPLLLSDPSYQE